MIELIGFPSTGIIRKKSGRGIKWIRKRRGLLYSRDDISKVPEPGRKSDVFADGGVDRER